MYSIALLMALTGGSEVADGHRHGGCGGCGGYVASCGCSGGHRHHRERGCGHHRHHGGCCGETACCAPVAPACGCCGSSGYGPGYGAPPAAMPSHEPIQAKPMEKKTQAAAPAIIVVELPADATLKVDGAVTSSTSNLRVLVSPELPTGKEFQYTLTAEVVREGKSVQFAKNVVVRAGEESRVSLSLPVTSVAQR
jgi:uncharacterized protein (TIGR03000 family)